MDDEILWLSLIMVSLTFLVIEAACGAYYLAVFQAFAGIYCAWRFWRG